MEREDFPDREAFALLDELVDVDGLPIEPRRERARHGRLAGRHEPDEINLVRFHTVRDPQDAPGPLLAMSRFSVSKKPGYEIATASAPAIVERDRAASAAIANAMAIR